MTLSSRAKWWMFVGLFGLGLAVLGTYFVIVGLERAERLSSVLGLFVGLLGLAIAVYGVYAARGSNSSRSSPQPTHVSPNQSGSGVQGNTFHGPTVIQSGDHNRQENNFQP
ncbi:hypothetical protein [Streptomyces winkii]|uniref:hypothetical protein n=1 Tax=Streptomyces winkii TaxID=3051178 RepID=UPI0028D6B174|nr:hypothetical protein [Streptomyces sp. DSM 40971]